jgi:hypothetical protein
MHRIKNSSYVVLGYLERQHEFLRYDLHSVINSIFWLYQLDLSFRQLPFRNESNRHHHN